MEQITYAQTVNLLTGLHGLKSLGGHQNNFDARTRIAILHNIKQLEAAQKHFQELLKTVIEENPDAATTDDNGNTALRLDHPLGVEFLTEVTTVDIRRLDFAAINTDDNRISIDAVYLLYDYLNNVEIPDEKEIPTETAQ